MENEGADTGLPDLDDDPTPQSTSTRKRESKSGKGFEDLAPTTKKKMIMPKPAETVINILSDSPSDVDDETSTTRRDEEDSADFSKTYGVKPKERKKTGVSEQDSLLNIMSQIYKKELESQEVVDKGDAVVAFGEYVVHQLRDITDKRERQLVQNEIQNVIFNHQMGYHKITQQPSYSPQGSSFNFVPSYQSSPLMRPQEIPFYEDSAIGTEKKSDKGKVHVSPGTKKTYAAMEKAKVVNTRSKKKQKDTSISSITKSKEALFEIPFKKL